jgi:hypothetical protein
MTPLDWVQTIGALIVLFSAIAIPTKILILVYEMRGTIKPWAERLKVHSGKIKEHDTVILQLPATLRDVTSTVNALRERINRMEMRSDEARTVLRRQVENLVTVVIREMGSGRAKQTPREAE